MHACVGQDQSNPDLKPDFTTVIITLQEEQPLQGLNPHVINLCAMYTLTSEVRQSLSTGETGGVQKCSLL